MMPAHVEVTRNINIVAGNKSLIYSQTDISEIKDRLANMEDLLKLYQTNQFAAALKPIHTRPFYPAHFGHIQNSLKKSICV